MELQEGIQILIHSQQKYLLVFVLYTCWLYYEYYSKLVVV